MQDWLMHISFLHNMLFFENSSCFDRTLKQEFVSHNETELKVELENTRLLFQVLQDV